MKDQRPLVGVIMGSTSDREVMQACTDQLQDLEIPYEVKVLSAHRTPKQTQKYAESASERGLEVLIAGAGWAAHLAGVIAANTTLPVIGVPIDSSPLNGMDALLATVQMPPGIPVATVALGKGGARNAAVLAAQILALKYPPVAGRFKTYRLNLTQKALER
jgi:phosphoribosylaminoimidazole carboxylase PurE protein